jgi:hypothetical protein
MCAALQIDRSSAFFQRLPGNPKANFGTMLAVGEEEWLEYTIGIFPANSGSFISH